MLGKLTRPCVELKLIESDKMLGWQNGRQSSPHSAQIVALEDIGSPAGTTAYTGQPRIDLVSTS